MTEPRVSKSSPVSSTSLLTRWSKVSPASACPASEIGLPEEDVSPDSERTTEAKEKNSTTEACHLAPHIFSDDRNSSIWWIMCNCIVLFPSIKGGSSLLPNHHFQCNSKDLFPVNSRKSVCGILSNVPARLKIPCMFQLLSWVPQSVLSLNTQWEY